MLRTLRQATIKSVYSLRTPLLQSRPYSKPPIDFQPYQIDRAMWEEIQSLTHDFKKRSPLGFEVLHRIDIEGMSLGSLSWLTHGHIAQAVMAIAGARTHEELIEIFYSMDHVITSNCGEGGDVNKHLVKQLASGRFDADLAYILEARRLQFKGAQPIKGGDGGSLAALKVDKLVAWIRNCIAWIDLHSPGPHADQYSIEDLRLLLIGYLLANARAEASVKLGVVPGIETIVLGCVKAMGLSEQGRRNNIVVSGKGSTGNTPLFTKYHSAYPVIGGIARSHAKLVEAGLRDNVTLTASGGFVGNLSKAFLFGADRIGIGTLALVGDGCDKQNRCETNLCSKGVATTNAELIAKNTGSPLTIARTLIAAAELSALEIQPYFDHISQAVGRAPDVFDAITNGPLTGHEEYLTLLRKKPSYVSLKKLPPQPGPTYKESEIIESIRTHKKTYFQVHANNEEIAFGTRLSAFTRTDPDIKEITLQKGITLNFSGFTGQNLGVLGAEGILFDASQVHTNDSTGKSLSGAEVYAKTCGNQAGFAMIEGALITRGVGSRGAVRKSGGVFMTEYAGAFFANFHTRGTTIILGKPDHYQDLQITGHYEPPFAFKEHALDFGFLSGFSGGSIIISRLLWEEALRLKHVSPMALGKVKVSALMLEDINTLLDTLGKSVRHLDSALQNSILTALKKNPELINQWFIKISPGLEKALNPAIGKIAIAEEQLGYSNTEKVKITTNTVNDQQKINANMVIPPDREKAACGTSLVMNLDKKATNEIVALGVQALGRSQHRGASGGDPLSGDGCGLMIKFGAGFFETRPEFSSLNLTHQRFGVVVVFMPKNVDHSIQAEEMLKHSLSLFGLMLRGKRLVPTNENKLGIQAKADEIQLTQYIVEPSSECENLAEFDRRLSLAHMNFEFTAQKLPMRHKPHVSSASRQFIIYKTKGKEKHIADIYPDLKDSTLTATVVMGHSRFATNTDTLIESVQPLAIAMFNGEVNNLRRFIEEIKYHPKFSQLIKVDLSQFDLTRYSDSAIMSYYMKMLQLLGYNSQQIHDAIFHPYVPTKTHAISEFHDLIGIPGLEGPNGSIRVYENGDELDISIEMDTMGWRPHRGIIDKKRGILATGSELGIFPDLQGEVIEMGPGEALKINPATASYMLMKSTPASQTVFSQTLAQIPVIDASDKYEHTPLQLSQVELHERKLRAGLTPDIEKTILEPMFNDGKGFTVSMGDDGGDEVTVSGPTRFVNVLKAEFAQITRPPLDYKREGEVMSGATYIGAKSLPEEIYQHSWNGVRVNNPIIDNDQMHFLLHTDRLTTSVIDCTYPVRGREAAMLKAIERVSASCKEAAEKGINFIVLSDLKSDAAHAPLLPSIISGMIDLALRKAGLRHKVTLCLQSSICTTPLEHIAALSFGANIINPYLIFMHDKLYVENKERFIRQRKSYLSIALKEVLATTARAGMRTLSAGSQGARLLSALGLNKEIADSLGIYSELGGIDWANIAATITDMHTRPGNVGKYKNEGQAAREGKWNVKLIALWHSIAYGEKTLPEVLPEFLSNMKITERDNIEGWFKKKPPMIWTPENLMKVVIAGGGASGFMQAKALLNSPMGKKIKILILEENPANVFGAIKDGIAPDKLETKKIQFALLSEYLKDPRVSYYGGVDVGKNGKVTFEELNRDYPLVIDCRGAPNDKEATEIKGHEFLIPASKVWKAYNGYFDPFNPNLYWPFKEHSRSQVKIVIGNGNVAADVIRNLLQDPNTSDAHPNFLDRLRRQKPSFVRNIARGPVTQCKITLQELESFEKNGIKVRADFDEENINEAELTEEQIKKLAFFRRAKLAPPTLDNEVCVHFHFGCTPKKVYEVGRNILEMEVVNENGEVIYLRGGDFISAIGRYVPEEPSNTPFVAGWASGNGGNLAIIQQSVEKTTAMILAHDEKRGFDHKMGPAPEKKWELEAPVTNLGLLNMVAYYSKGNHINSVETWREARDYQEWKTNAPVETNATTQVQMTASTSPKTPLAVINPKTNEVIPLSLNQSSVTVYNLLKESANLNKDIPVPDNTCDGQGTCIRCVSEVSPPITQKPAEKLNLITLYGKKALTMFLTCQHPVSDLTADGAHVVRVKNPVK